MSTRKTPEQKIADLEKKQSQIKAQIQKAKAQARDTERKADTRRKIVAGALALEHMAHDSEFAATMHRLLNRHVKRDSDRLLFGLDGTASGDAPANDAAESGKKADDGASSRGVFSRLAGRS